MKSSKLNKKRREKIGEIKKEYLKYADLIEKEPPILQILGWSFLVVVVLMLLFELLCSFVPPKVFLILFTICFFLSLVLAIANIVGDRKYKIFHKKKSENIRELSQMILGDAGKTYGLSAEEMALYLYKFYKNPLAIKVLLFVISLGATVCAVYILPGYGGECSGFAWFCILVLMNFLFSILGDVMCNEIKSLQNIDHYLINPFMDKFEKVDDDLLK